MKRLTAGVRLTAAAALAAATVVLAAMPAAAGSAPSGDPIRIGWANTDEGGYSFPGMTAGVEAAVAYVNASGGINSRPIELVSCVMAGDEASSAACGQQLGNDTSLTAIAAGINLFSGPFFQATSGQGWTVVGAVPLTAADFAAPGVVFWNSGVLGQIGAAAAYVTQLPDVASVAVVYDDNPAAAGAAQQIVDAAEAAGLTVTSVPVPAGAADFTVPITAAGAEGADVFMLMVDQRGCIAAAGAISQLGLDSTVVGTAPCADDSVIESAGDQVDGWYFADGGSNARLGSGVDPEVDEYLEQFATHGEGAPTQSFASYGWGTILALADVLGGLGDALDQESVNAAVSAFTGPVPLGARTVSCPGPVIPAVCTGEGRIFQIVGDVVVDANNGEVIDPTAAPAVASAPAGSAAPGTTADQ